MTSIRRLLPFPIRPLGLMTTAAMATMLVGPTAQAFEVGHSRLLSVAGEPLRITIPLTQLSENDIQSLRITAADLPAWKAAQLSPPVDLASLQFTVNAGQTKNTRLIQVSSPEVFNQAIADLLVDIHTAQGSKRHQVSLLAHDGGQAFASRKKTAAALDESDQEAASTPRTRTDNTSLIIVRPGDSMTAIAQRHAVDGFSMYQLMMALQRANPDAFINNNVNLVKAGSRLTMPDSKALAAISDREARRLFHQHLLAHKQGKAIQEVAKADTSEPAPIQDAPDAAPSQQEADSSNTQAAATQETSQEFSDETLENGMDDSATQADTTTAELRHDELRLSRAPTASPPAAEFNDFERHWQSGQPGDLMAPPQDGLITVQSVSDMASDSPSAKDDDAVATDKALSDAKQRVSQLEENVKNLNQALQSQGSAAHEAVLEGAASLRQSFGEVADAVSDVAQSIEREFSDEATDDDHTTENGIASEVESQDSLEQDTSASATTKLESWINKHMNSVLLAGLGIIILLLVWILRLLSRRRHDAAKAITPEMVQEKLDQINLDLQEPTVDSSQKPS